MGIDNLTVLLTTTVLITYGINAEVIKINETSISTTEKNPLVDLILNDSRKYVNESENEKILSRERRQFGYYYPYERRQYYPLPLFGGLGGFGPIIGFSGRSFGGRGFGGGGFGGRGFGGGAFGGREFGGGGFGGRGFGGGGFGGRGIGIGGRGFGGGFGGGRGGRG